MSQNGTVMEGKKEKKTAGKNGSRKMQPLRLGQSGQLEKTKGVPYCLSIAFKIIPQISQM